MIPYSLPMHELKVSFATPLRLCAFAAAFDFTGDYPGLPPAKPHSSMSIDHD